MAAKKRKTRATPPKKLMRPKRPPKITKARAAREGLRKWQDKAGRWRDRFGYTSEPIAHKRALRRYVRELEQFKVDYAEAERRAKALRRQRAARAKREREALHKRRSAAAKKGWATRRKKKPKPKPKKPKPKPPEPPKPKPKPPPEYRLPRRDDPKEIRRYLQEVLEEACRTLTGAGYECHYNTHINRDGSVDSDFTVVGEDAFDVTFAIEEYAQFAFKPKPGTPLWISVGLEIDISQANAAGFTYPTRDRGTFRIWTWPTEIDGAGDTFLLARQMLGAEREGGLLAGSLTSVIVRIHWNPRGTQPGRRRS